MRFATFRSFLCQAILGILVAGLAGCASVTPSGSQPHAGSTPTVGQIIESPAAVPAGTSEATSPADGSAPQGSPTTGADGATPVEASPPPLVSSNRAVIALVDRARGEAGAGRRESAGATLERALRIEPRNAWLWHELGRLRLTQGQYAQAVSLAQKSNSLAVRERTLQALNWHLIADARISQGDFSGAAQARQRAETLQKP